MRKSADSDGIRSPLHLIDFVDVGFGDLRWPVFNVADSFVTVGVLVLALTYSRVAEPTEETPAAEPPAVEPPVDSVGDGND